MAGFVGTVAAASKKVFLTRNKYVYGGGDPVNMVDPSGRFSLASIGTALNTASRLI